VGFFSVNTYMRKFFCPAPWRSIYYHVDKAAVCCVSDKKFSMTPMQFVNSDYLKELRQKFLNEEFDDTCITCKRLEDAGLQSVRQHMVGLYGENITPTIDYMELRTSNLCNFQCKMCNAESSSLIANEVFNITDENFNEILLIAQNLKTLVLTGGEPMLIKHYYELLDHLAMLGKPDLNLRIYTNASVYNPIFIEKILKFNTRLHLSIDAVGDTAVAQRTGTNWTVVNENVNKFLELPIRIQFHTTLTTISLSDIHSLAKYFFDIATKKPSCTFNIHTARRPAHLSVFNIKEDEIPKTVESIDAALEILTLPNFNQFRNQLISCRRAITAKLK